ncbi:hypothetical protein LTR53_016152 [Teratosphaeriaceae sp. CCFEE 6253]|nr:hypothetical protein LTR53_016152 [Teratosphaeriaceae sp. CCFEE 6253]
MSLPKVTRSGRRVKTPTRFDDAPEPAEQQAAVPFTAAPTNPSQSRTTQQTMDDADDLVSPRTLPSGQAFLASRRHFSGGSGPPQQQQQLPTPHASSPSIAQMLSSSPRRPPDPTTSRLPPDPKIRLLYGDADPDGGAESDVGTDGFVIHGSRKWWANRRAEEALEARVRAPLLPPASTVSAAAAAHPTGVRKTRKSHPTLPPQRTDRDKERLHAAALANNAALQQLKRDSALDEELVNAAQNRSTYTGAAEAPPLSHAEDLDRSREQPTGWARDGFGADEFGNEMQPLYGDETGLPDGVTGVISDGRQRGGAWGVEGWGYRGRGGSTIGGVGGEAGGRLTGVEIAAGVGRDPELDMVTSDEEEGQEGVGGGGPTRIIPQAFQQKNSETLLETGAHDIVSTRKQLMVHDSRSSARMLPALTTSQQGNILSPLS